VNDADRSAGPGFTLHRDAFGKLVLTWPDGRQFTGVVPVRVFPFSAPREGLSLCDPAGHEIVWIELLDALPDHLRQLLEEEMAEREFVPIIHRIRWIRPRIEPSEWEVETDRGRVRFVLNSADDIRRLDDVRAIVVDAHGVRYLIADRNKLDLASRRLLERYL
jgi:hypothetical protein